MKNTLDIYKMIHEYEWQLTKAKFQQIRNYKPFNDYIDFLSIICDISINILMRGEY